MQSNAFERSIKALPSESCCQVFSPLMLRIKGFSVGTKKGAKLTFKKRN